MADLKDYGFEEEASEEAYMQKGIKTGYPKPARRYWLVYETPNQSVEEAYFWVLNFLRVSMGFREVEKIMDIFSASHQSSFFGVAMQRTGIYQDKVSQYLAAIGKMVKELFQLVREIRILDERISYYQDSYDASSKSRESAEITLKGIWIDMVEGGAKNPASVYGMARELEFTVLPDLFFSTHPTTPKEVDQVVDALEFNRKVREVLKRKLRAFMEWKDHTYKEIKTRRKFTVRFLRQHYDVIKMYMSWIKPYLKFIRMSHLSEKKMDSPDLIGPFEGSMVEIEILAKKFPVDKTSGKVKDGAKYKPCVLVNFDYRTTPQMRFTGEGYQRGPVHAGRVEMKIRSYAWSEEQIEKYKAYRDRENMELLGLVDNELLGLPDGSIQAAMDALGEDLENYLKEAGEEFDEKQDKPSKKQESVIDPFLSVFRGFGEIGKSFSGDSGQEKKKKMHKFYAQKEISDASGQATQAAWLAYKNFRKGHRMITW